MKLKQNIFGATQLKDILLSIAPSKVNTTLTYRPRIDEIETARGASEVCKYSTRRPCTSNRQF